MIKLGKELERSQDKEVMAVTSLASADAKVLRIASDIYGVRERYQGNADDWRATVYRAKYA